MERLTREELKIRAEAGTLLGAFRVNIDDYHTGPGLSSTDIKNIAKSPGQWYSDKINGIKIASEALSFGTLYHTVALEHSEFENRYVITSLSRRGSKAWDEQECEAINSGKQLVKESDMEKVRAMHERILSHSKRAMLLGLTEATFYWKDAQTGVLCKARPDVITENGIVVDLKTTKCKTDQELQKDIYFYGYHISAAMQLVAVREVNKTNVENFVFFFQNKEAPFDIFVRHLDPASIKLGSNVFIKALKTFKELQETNGWDAQLEILKQSQISKLEALPASTDEDIKMLGVPDWALAEVYSE